jgi:hypothetical protein
LLCPKNADEQRGQQLTNCAHLARLEPSASLIGFFSLATKYRQGFGHLVSSMNAIFNEASKRKASVSVSHFPVALP